MAGKVLAICSFLVVVLSGAGQAEPPAKKPATFLLDAGFLQQNKAKIQQGDAALLAVRQELLRTADQTLTKKAHSVTEKTKLPPSGDKHDYMSVGPYWWPDPTKPDGLPYIRKDGQVNPERQAIPDATYLSALCSDVQLLAVAYYFSDDEKYARRAAELVRIWFLNPDTRMNPNLNYGQAIPGITEGRGIGLIDTRALVKLVDAVQLLTDSKAWPQADHQALQGWFRQFASWMQNSPVGKDEADEHNNHGTYYDFQVVGYALFTGDKAQAKRLLEQNTYPRIQSQLKPDGSQPHELARTLSWNYSVMNLRGFFGLALLGENVGLDLWRYETPDGKSLRKAYQWLVPHANNQKVWEHQQIKEMHREEFDDLRLVAAQKYGEAPISAESTTGSSPAQAPLFVLTRSLF